MDKQLDQQVKDLEQRVAAPEGKVQEQLIGKCNYCNAKNILPHKIQAKPKFCMQCGNRINYSLSKKPSSLKVDGDPQ